MKAGVAFVLVTGNTTVFRLAQVRTGARGYIDPILGSHFPADRSTQVVHVVPRSC